ncbi:hypothetical protein HZS_5140 [Henneguya salminicola]|nr:hypothetical protein HZS_5140 [Henneguya salminicola]
MKKRFAHFFISPLLVKETMESELIAVDNEFQSARMSDELRSDRLLQLSMIPDHPASYFSNGNLITLKTNIDKCAIDLRERVKQHWEHFYAPQIMSAVIFAPTSLNIIEQSVLSHLNNIP